MPIAARVLCALALAASACEGGTAQMSDAGTPDARPLADAAPAVACGDAGACASASRPLCHPERGVCVACVESADCSGRGYQTACASGRGDCVECTGEGDCGDGALGPRCDPVAGQCTCESDGDCADSLRGSRCHDVVRACTCLTADDCPGDATCELEPYLGAGVRVCRPPS